MHKRLISIVLPVYNQADHIGTIIQEYTDALKRIEHSYELVVVVNGSRDQSFEVCQSLAKQNPSIRVLHSPQRGWGLAVRLGLKESRGEIICYTNSARTSPQDLILIVVYALAYPNVVIKANRKTREHWRRGLGSLLYNLECRALFDLTCWDINGTPKVFPRQFEKLLMLQRDDDLLDVEFGLTCRREGYPILEVPIFSDRRHGGKSTTNYHSALNMYWGAYQLWRK
jgi:glycosyltransferase involved in cell wall biosynthesis